MKTSTLKTLAFLILLTFLARFANAGNVPTPATPKGESEKTIRNYFKFPQVLIQHQDAEKNLAKKVEVVFTTEASGAVNFVIAKTDDRDLKNEIERQFLKLKLPKLKHDTVYSVVLSFRTV